MRALAHACALALLLLSVATSSPAKAQSAPGFDTGHHFIVVTFSNDPYRRASRAGTTGRRYTGDSYGVAQSAHDKAQRVAAAYSLRQVASWPIRELAVHCVVYEIPDSRSVAEVLTALTKDPRITLAQPLQQFHTLSNPQPTMTSPDNTAVNSKATTGYNDPLYGLQTNLAALGI